jgi:hypothetical protein
MNTAATEESTIEPAPGRRGAQPGNLNAAKFKQCSDVIRRMGLENDGQKLRQLGEKLWSMALDGDMQAIKEIMDRWEGKVPAAVEMSGPGGGDLVIRDANTAMGVARRVAFVLAHGAISKAQASAKEPEKGAARAAHEKG